MIARLCVVGFVFIGLGNSLMAALSQSSFGWICASTVIRSMGSSLVWTDSALLIQKFTPPALLGRVNSIDTAAALLGDCVSNLGGGLLMDRLGFTPEQLSWVLAVTGFSFTVIFSPLGFKLPPKVRSSAKT